MIRLIPAVVIALANLVAAYGQEKPAQPERPAPVEKAARAEKATSAEMPGQAEMPRQTSLPDAAVEVPLKLINSQPAVEVRINGEGPFLFLFDTGAAGGGRIDAELSEKLKLPEVDEVQMGDPSGKHTRTGKRVRAAELQIGDARFKDLLLLRRDERDPVELSRAGIKGIIGIGTFADTLVTLDYPGGKLRIVRGELPPPDEREILAYAAEHGIPNIALKIGAVELRADVDSGSMGSLSVPADLVKKLELTRAPVVTGRARTSFNEFEIKESRLKGEFHLGRHVFESPVIAFNDLFPHGNLGGGILHYFAITIDQKNQRIRFAREGHEPIRAEKRYRVGVAFLPESGALRVREVAPGGAGAAAGLKVDDRVVKINGKAIADLPDDEPRSLFSRPDPVRLTIERDGKTIEVELTPKSVE